MALRKRKFFAALIAAIALLGSFSAHGQAWPEKPIKFVVGYAAGSATDGTTRFFADKIREATAQTVLVENKPGADANLAAEMVALHHRDTSTGGQHIDLSLFGAALAMSLGGVVELLQQRQGAQAHRQRLAQHHAVRRIPLPRRPDDRGEREPACILLPASATIDV